MLRRIARKRRHAGRAAARRPALGRRRLARLPRATWSQVEPRRADAGARPDAARAVRAPRRLDRRRGAHQRIDLAPLEHERAAALLADELLQEARRRCPPTLRELITGGAEGNPFYMEELVKMLVDEGAIDTDGERWTRGPRQAASPPRAADADRRAAGAPGRLHAGREARAAAGRVIGFVFWDQALAAIDRRAADGAARRWCGASWSMPHRDTALDGAREYAFKHQILHQVTYDTVLKRTRRELSRQGRGAGWPGTAASRPSDFPRRHRRALREGRRPAERAAEYFTPRRRARAERYAHEAALDHVARALALLEKSCRQPRTRRPIAADSSCAGGCSTCASARSTCAGRRDEQRADIDALQRGWPTHSTTTAGAPRSPGGEASSRCAPADYRDAGERVARRRWRTRGARATKASACARSRRWRSRSTSSAIRTPARPCRGSPRVAARARGTRDRIALSERVVDRREHAGGHGARDRT